MKGQSDIFNRRERRVQRRVRRGRFANSACFAQNSALSAVKFRSCKV